MKILFVAATKAEAEIINGLKNHQSAGAAVHAGHQFEILVTGIGSAATISSMYRWIIQNGKPDLAINIGIAGSFTDTLATGDVVAVGKECFADLGIEDHDRFMTLAEAGLEDSDAEPYTGGWLHAESVTLSKLPFLRKVVSVTVNMATGSEITCERLKQKYNADIETMEGASFFYVCIIEKIPFIALRSISNRIEARNREKWNIRLALDNLKACLEDVLLIF